MKRIIWMVAAGVLLLGGCQATPERENVVAKGNFEEQLQAETQEPTDVTAYAEALPQHIEKRYEKTKMTITMDADVQCDVDYAEIPVYKFAKATLPQEKMQEWVRYFAEDAKLYPWPVFDTKEYYWQKLLEAQQGNEVDGELVVDEDYIAELQRCYEEAPDGKTRFYIDPVYDYPNGNIEAGKSTLSAAIEREGADDSVYAQTRELGEIEDFSGFDYCMGMDVISEITIYDSMHDTESEYHGYDEDIKKTELGMITEQEARPIAEQVLRDLGITEMQLVKSGKGCLTSFDNQFGISSVRKDLGGMHLLYLRSLSGLTVDRDIVDVINASQVFDADGTRLTQPSIRTEKVDIFITNDGEVGRFEYNGILEQGEQLSEAVTLMDFDEITERAAEQLYFQNSFLGEMTGEIAIDSASLVLTYSAAENDFDSILLIPAWKFSGTLTLTAPSGQSSEDTVTVTINAIDGSRA